MSRLGSIFIGVVALLAGAAPVHAQLSFTSAVDLALRTSPQVKMAEADVDKARAAVAQAKDVYIPSVTGSSGGLGYAYGFPLGVPTVFGFTASSLIFSYSQHDYIRAAESGLMATNLALKDVREQVAEDTVSTYFQLDRAEEQRDALAGAAEFAERLQAIVKDRVEAGQDNAMEYTKSRKTGAQIRLQLLQLDDSIASYEDHLGRLTGLTGMPIETVPSSIPTLPEESVPATIPDSPAVQAAFAIARQKREQAFGDARYSWRPEITFGAEYSRFSTFNNQYVNYYPSVAGRQENAIGFGLNISVPLFNAEHKAGARLSLAEAIRSQHEAENIRNQSLEGRLKLQHSTAELAAKAELASLDKDMAEEQLQVVLLQLQATPNGATPVTPKEEQNARIQERQRTLDVIDATYQVREARVSLLRQTGQLEAWLKSVASIDVDGAPPDTNRITASKKP
jgi:outer membrane protein TolC